MPYRRFHFLTRKIDMVDVLRACSVLALILMAIAFFSGCETNTKAQADSNGVMRKQENTREIHGEVGAMYGHSF
jgi:hypothetical protein